ncbi:MAG: hypothetical protein KAS39_04805, partial [Actinomycetia bacterium]|nr:hypothetical protein [Actinomycetes bacterium]
IYPSEGVLYARTGFKLDKREMVKFWITSRNPLKIFIDGSEVYYKDIYERDMNYTEVLKIELESGIHEVMVKILNRDSFNFMLGISDMDNEDIKVENFIIKSAEERDKIKKSELISQKILFGAEKTFFGKYNSGEISTIDKFLYSVILYNYGKIDRAFEIFDELTEESAGKKSLSVFELFCKVFYAELLIISPEKKRYDYSRTTEAKRILKEIPEGNKVLLSEELLAEILFFEDSYISAYSLFEDILKKEPGFSRTRYYLSYIAYLKDWDWVFEENMKRLGEEEYFYDSNLLLIKYYEDEKNYKKLIEVYEKYLTMNSYSSIRLDYSKLLLKCGYPDKALEELKIYFSIYGTAERSILVDYYIRTGEYEKAEILLEEVIKSKRDNYYTYYQLARISDNRGEDPVEEYKNVKLKKPSAFWTGDRLRHLTQENIDIIDSYINYNEKAVSKKFKFSDFKKRYPDSSICYLIDKEVFQLYPDMKYRYYIHQRAVILNKKGIDDIGEVSIPENAKLLFARTITDGKSYDVYSRTKVRSSSVLSMPQLEVG